MKKIYVILIFVFGVAITAFSQSENSRIAKKVPKSQLKVIPNKQKSEVKTRTVRIMPKSKIDEGKIEHPMKNKTNKKSKLMKTKAVTEKKKK